MPLLQQYSFQKPRICPKFSSTSSSFLKRIQNLESSYWWVMAQTMRWCQWLQQHLGHIKKDWACMKTRSMQKKRDRKCVILISIYEAFFFFFFCASVPHIMIFCLTLDISVQSVFIWDFVAAPYTLQCSEVWPQANTILNTNHWSPIRLTASATVHIHKTTWFVPIYNLESLHRFWICVAKSYRKRCTEETAGGRKRMDFVFWLYIYTQIGSFERIRYFKVC